VNRPLEVFLKLHLQDATLLLYDVSSSYYTGHKAGLVQFGYNRDRKRGFPQIVYGLLCNGQGCPVSIEVFGGNTADPSTLPSQIQKVRKRFGLCSISRTSRSRTDATKQKYPQSPS